MLFAQALIEGLMLLAVCSSPERLIAAQAIMAGRKIALG